MIVFFGLNIFISGVLMSNAWFIHDRAQAAMTASRIRRRYENWAMAIFLVALVLIAEAFTFMLIAPFELGR
jgi:hypothetical protein